MRGESPRPVKLRGRDLIREPLLNKGSAFTPEERRAFGLEGLLPPRTLSMELQARRVWASLSRLPEPMDRFLALESLHDRNEHLYFHVLGRHLEALMPVVYTPTVGLATRRFSHVFRRGRGVWITPEHRGRIAEVLAGAAHDRDIRLLVVTDNEAILGIGDQGAGGMAIAIGKLALYTAIAGVDPATVLPVSLDVGTDNEELLADELYLGCRQRRLRGADYESLLDEFVDAVRTVMPRAVLQWEDLRKDNALRVLDRYRDRLPSFNDDIQGTGAVGLAALLAAARVTGRPLADERVLILGAGAAGLGITRQIRTALCLAGVDVDDARRAVGALDRNGLIVDDGSIRDPYKKELAWTPEDVRRARLSSRDLAGVVREWAPGVLIGTSGHAGAFTESIVRDMAGQVERPVILPLSNPTDLCEATPADLAAWTDGRALVATGSPFDPVESRGSLRRVAQGNNAFIFPAVGLASLVAAPDSIPDTFFARAAEALATAVTDEELAEGLLFPPVGRAPEVCSHVAAAVLAEALDLRAEEAATRIDGARWEPVYRPYIPA